jgi:hypothetical protein
VEERLTSIRGRGVLSITLDAIASAAAAIAITPIIMFFLMVSKSYYSNYPPALHI